MKHQKIWSNGNLVTDKFDALYDRAYKKASGGISQSVVVLNGKSYIIDSPNILMVCSIVEQLGGTYIGSVSVWK